MNSESTNNSAAPSYQGPLRPGAATERIQPATVIIVLVACIFNALSILLVSRYLYIRFSRERLAYAEEQEAQRSRRQRARDTGPEGSMQTQLARFTPILVLQPDSKVACAHKEPRAPDAAGPGISATAALPSRSLQTMYISQLPQGTTLYPGPPLRASASTRSLGQLSQTGGGSVRDLHQAGSSSSNAQTSFAEEVRIDVGGGSSNGEADLQAQQSNQAPPQQQEEPRRPSLLSVAYLGSGVYLWGARRDPLYRDRVHGHPSAAYMR